MADYNSSLPIRSEADVDERVQTKIVDATNPDTQQLAVNADGSINITDNGGSITIDAVDLDIRDLDHAQDSVRLGDGTNLTNVNASGELQVRDDDANTALSSLDGKFVDGNDIGDVTINNAAGAAAVNIQDGGNSITVDATDLDIRDLNASQDNVAISDGTDTLAVNTDGSINVNVVDSVAGNEVCDYQTSSSVAKNASVNHDYTVTGGTTFSGEEAWISGSGKIKVELLVDGATKFVGFNSTSNPNIRIPLEKLLKAGAAEVVRMTITNRDNQPQDVYSTLLGEEN